MTANPDSALRQALVAAEKRLSSFDDEILPPILEWLDEAQRARIESGTYYIAVAALLRGAREAHALITEALAQSQDKP